MAALGSVVVELSANVAKFQSDMGKAAAIAEQRMREIDKSIGIVKTALGAIGIGFAAGATFDKIKEKIEGAISSAAGLQQLSERTGSTVEALSGLAAVAKLSGTDTESLAAGLQKLSKSMIDAENGGTKTSESFKAIGISTDEIKGKRADEVFKLIADNLIKYQDGAEKTVIAQNLLGKAGANLLPTLRDLAEAGDLQVKVTSEQAIAADEYEKNLKRLQASTDAIFKKIGLELVPVFNAFTKALLETQNANDGVKKSVTELAQDGSIRSWAESAAIAVGFLVDGFDGVARTAQIAGLKIGATAAGMKLLFSGNLEGARSAIDDSDKQVDRILNKGLFSDRLKKQLDAVAKAANAAPSAPRAKIDATGIGNSNGPKDDPTQKILEGKLKAQEDFVASENKLLQQREQQLQYYAGLEYLTERDAIEAKQKLITDNLIVVQSAYDKEIKLLDDRIRTADKETERQDARNKLQEVIKKRSEAEVDANNKIVQSQEALLAIQRQFDNQTKESDRQQDKRNSDAQFQIDILGKSTLEVAQLCEQRRIQLDLEERIYQLRKKDPSADVSDAIARADAQKVMAGKLVEESYSKQREGAFGASEAIRKYGEDASNTAAQIESGLTNAFKGAEDAFVTFATTGKLSFSSLAQSILADLARIQAKNLIASLTGSSGGSSAGGIIGMIGSLFTGGGAVTDTGVSGDSIRLSGPPRAEGGPVWTGSSFMVGEKGPEIFTPPSAGTIIPNSALQGGGSGQSVSITQQIQIDSRSDQQSIRDAMNQAKEAAKAEISNLIARGSRQFTRPA